MVKLGVFLCGLLASSANAFTSVPQARPNAFVSRLAASSLATPEVDDIGNNLVVKNVLLSAEASGLLSKVAESRLLSKAQAAGVSLSTLEPFLELAADNPDLLILVEASGPDILPLLPTAVELAPDVLPLLAAALDISPGLLQTVGLASFAAAAGVIFVVPDDTIVQVAVQTLAAALLGAAGAASLVGSDALKDPAGFLKKTLPLVTSL